MKPHKKRILAALALILSLAVVVPFFIAHGSHGAAISGSFTVPNPARDVTVELRDSGGTIVSSVIVSPINASIPVNFNFYEIPPGTYSLIFHQPGHTSFTLSRLYITAHSGHIDLRYYENFPAMLPLLPGNVTGSGQINVADLVMMLQHWMGYYINANPTGSGQINITDLNMLLQNWMAESVNHKFMVDGPRLYYPISAYGRRVAEEFLHREEFLTVFEGVGFRDWRGYFIDRDTGAIAEEQPHIFWDAPTEQFIKGGHIITQAPWINGEYFASDFSLRSIDDSGIPVIAVYFRTYAEQPAISQTPSRMYKYVNGEFRAITFRRYHVHSLWTQPWVRYGYFNPLPDAFLTDSTGRLAARFNVMTSDRFENAYAYISFDEERIIAERIAENHIGEGGLHWYNHITHEHSVTHFSWDDFLNANLVFIPGINEVFTRIQPLTSLRDIIYASIQASLSYQPSYLSPAALKSALLEAEANLLRPEIFGHSPSFVGTHAMYIYGQYLIAQITSYRLRIPAVLRFTYEAEEGLPAPNIIWRLADIHSSYMCMRYLQPQNHRYITNKEIVPIRFHFHCSITDPQFELHPEAFLYNTVEIPGPYLWGEFRRRMYEHTGIGIWNLWFEGSKLYVDLHSTELMPFGWGTTGSATRFNVLTRTLASFPGITSFEVLLGGEHGVWADHASFDWIAIVEDGVIVRFEYRA